MASQFEIEVEPTKSGPRVRMYDVDQDSYTPWGGLRAAWRNAPAEVAFAAALSQSHLLDEMFDTAKSIAYAVYLNDEAFDIHQVDDDWIAATLAGWSRDRLTGHSCAIGDPPPKPKM